MKIYTSYPDKITVRKEHQTKLYNGYIESSLKTKSGAGIYSYRFKTTSHCSLKVDYPTSFYKLVLCFDGYSESYLGGKKLYSFKKGKAVFYNTLPGTYHSNLEADTRFNIVHLHLPHTMVEELRILAPRLFREPVIEIPLPKQSFSLLNINRDLSYFGDELTDLFLEKTILEQMYGVLETIVRCRKGFINTGRTNTQKITEAVSLINESHRYFTISELARKVGLNTFQLKNLFKKELNKTVFEYQVERHFSTAYNLLLETQNTVSEIALMCGYQSVGSFSNAFKRQFGIRPSDLRKF
ncbi:MAG: AraC family transcriptional regulator [Balneolales bacterium]